MIVLSIIPFLVAFPARKKRIIFLTGPILFAVGGIVPLLILLANSAVEIFFQNFLTGVVAASLMALKRRVGRSR